MSKNIAKAGPLAREPHHVRFDRRISKRRQGGPANLKRREEKQQGRFSKDQCKQIRENKTCERPAKAGPPNQKTIHAEKKGPAKAGPPTLKDNRQTPKQYDQNSRKTRRRGLATARRPREPHQMHCKENQDGPPRRARQPRKSLVKAAATTTNKTSLLLA